MGGSSAYSVLMKKTRLIAGIIVAALLVGAVFVYVMTSRRSESATTRITAPGAGSHEVTPTDKMGVRTAESEPKVDELAYRLEVSGLTGSKLSLSLNDIKAMKVEERFVKLPCVEGWTDQGIWKGVRLREVLDRAGLKEEARTIVFKSPNGYTTSLTVADVAKTDPILAYGVNNERLPDNQGYPIRLVVPDKLGYKWIKWVTAIEAIKGTYVGFWESRGYSNEADATGR